jgi:hypothetical protein
LADAKQPTELKMIEDWDKDDEGNIITSPVSGFEMFVVARTSIALRLTGPNPLDESEKSEAGFQFVLGPMIALQIAQALSDAAGRILSQTPSGPVS